MTRLLSAILSAVLLTLSFPPFDFYLLTWIALVPLLLVAMQQSAARVLMLFFLTGMAFFMGVCHHVNTISGFKPHHFVLLGIYLSAYVGLGGFVAKMITSRTQMPILFVLPAVMVSMEYLRTNAGFMGLPWALIGHSQYANLPVIQIASFTGVYGVSFLIVMANVAISECVYNWGAHWAKDNREPVFTILRPAWIPIVIVGISASYGFFVMSSAHSWEQMAVTVVQGNIPQEMKWKPEYAQRNFAKYVALTRTAASGGGAPLVVWPESAVQGDVSRDIGLSSSLFKVARETGSWLLIGSAQRPKFGDREFRNKHHYNSAILISPEGTVQGTYNKVHLLPFAEYLPYRDRMPWPQSLAALAGHYIPGQDVKIFQVQDQRFAVLICWENIFPDLFRRAVFNGARLMVNITNEAWFGQSAASHQILTMNVFRAVENRVSVVRAANTGVSCFIDPRGAISGRVMQDGRDIFVQGFLTQQVPITTGITFYTAYGDVFAMAMVALSALALLKAFAVNPEKSSSPKTVRDQYA